MKTYSAFIPLKSQLFLIPLLLATSAAVGDALPASSAHEWVDGQVQAAALLSRPQTVGTVARSPSSASTTTDAQAMAAALLSRPRTGVTTQAAPVSSVLSSADGHARAAALLSRARTT